MNLTARAKEQNLNLEQRAQQIKVLIFDIDGVMTDGRMGYSNDPDDEIKFFNARDGLGLRQAMRAGFMVGAVSGRRAKANHRRLISELCFSFLYEKVIRKGDTIPEIAKEHDFKLEECLYIGDDLIDIPVFRQVGLSGTVSDAAEYMDEYCDFRTSRAGGFGAVREAIDWLLHVQGKWDKSIERYTK